MICVKEYIISQQVVWVKRAQLSTRDNWRYDLKRICRGNCWTLSPAIVDKTRHPILYNLAVSYEIFVKKFYCKDDNYTKSFVLNNPIFCRSREDDRRLSISFFNQVPVIDPGKLAVLRFSDIFENNSMKSLHDINEQLGIAFNLLTYMRLGSAMTNFYRSLKLSRITDGSSICIDRFFTRFKQGSKPIRNILNFKPDIDSIIPRQQFVKTFYRLVGIAPICVKKTKHFLGFWENHFLHNKLREFILKYNSNILGINTRVAHFTDNNSRACTFCTIKKSRPLPDESFVHIFFECPTTSGWLRHFEREFFVEFNFESDMDRKNFWFCQHLGELDIYKNSFIISCIWCIKFCIWEAKLMKKTPSNLTLTLNVLQIFSEIYDNSQKVRNEKDLHNFIICRSWDAVRGRW